MLSATKKRAERQRVRELVAAVLLPPGHVPSDRARWRAENEATDARNERRRARWQRRVLERARALEATRERRQLVIAVVHRALDLEPLLRPALIEAMRAVLCLPSPARSAGLEQSENSMEVAE